MRENMRKPKTVTTCSLERIADPLNTASSNTHFTKIRTAPLLLAVVRVKLQSFTPNLQPPWRLVLGDRSSPRTPSLEPISTLFCCFVLSSATTKQDNKNKPPAGEKKATINRVLEDSNHVDDACFDGVLTLYLDVVVCCWRRWFSSSSTTNNDIWDRAVIFVYSLLTAP